MLPLRRILCPTDFSDCSYQAIEKGVELAKYLGGLRRHDLRPRFVRLVCRRTLLLAVEVRAAPILSSSTPCCSKTPSLSLKPLSAPETGAVLWLRCAWRRRH